MSARDALGVLGLAAAADQDRLRGAYLAAVKAAHPDRPGGDAERLRKVIEAYGVLRAGPVAGTPAPSRAAKPAQRPASRTLEICATEAVVGGVRKVALDGGGEVSVRLPPGLRVGDIVAVNGAAMTVAIGGGADGAIVGDHLCMTVEVDPAILARGGGVELEGPRGRLNVQITAQDAARGLVRVAGEGLPARGVHGQGDLLIKLRPKAAYETRTRVLLRRFTAAWAA